MHTVVDRDYAGSIPVVAAYNRLTNGTNAGEYFLLSSYSLEKVMGLKEDILALRAKGKTYSQIADELKCTKAVLSYHVNPNAKGRHNTYQKTRRESNPVIQKTERFRGKPLKALRDRTDGFQRRSGSKVLSRNNKFNYHDIVEKIGPNPQCYLTGRPIDLSKSESYQFDHIMPATRGCDNSLNNLGLACRQANQMKSDMTVEELVQIAIELLENFGYKVTSSGHGKPIGDGDNLENC